jgi:hypothetical protein
MIASTTLRHWLCALVLLCMAFACGRAWGQPPVQASDVKAAYLQKFPGFVDWPPDAFANSTSPFVMGVAGSEPVFGDLLDAARAGRRVLGRPIEVRQVAAGALPRGLHVLFIGREAAAEAATLVAEARTSHVLVVTDLPTGLQLGAALNFVEADGRVRFEAAPAAARRFDLKLGSALLSVAMRVVEEP